MAAQLSISAGQYSTAGIKAVNQDFHALQIPEGPLLHSKGIALALADGISSSDVSQDASATAVRSFLSDYFCTSEAWSVKTSAQKVLAAINSWLYAQTRQSQYRSDPNRGYVCTFSALIIKSTTAHLFHVGDTRIYRVQGNRLEQLTNDHRFYYAQQQSYLTRALGMAQQLDLDYQSLSVENGDTFMIATDGVYEFIDPRLVSESVLQFAQDLDRAAEHIVRTALANGSDDNLTVQLLRIDSLPQQTSDDIHQQLTELPFPPELEARAEFDGYRILRQLHASSRSHVYLATDMANGETVVLKTPSMELRDDTAYLERFLMEEWIARRIHSAHVLKPVSRQRKANYLYVVTEYIEGRTLSQWLRDNPQPALDVVRDIVGQIGRGLRAFHRLEMIHQDLKPDNIMIDHNGTVKIIDFGATRVAGILEIDSPVEQQLIAGTAQYTAPEYFLGYQGSPAADVFSLGVITYQMLTGKLPYGLQVSKSRTLREQNRLSYTPIHHTDEKTRVPRWVDEAIRKSLQVEPHKRYQEADEFIYDLHHPNRAFLNRQQPPLIERNPVKFWQSVSALLLLVVICLVYSITGS